MHSEERTTNVQERNSILLWSHHISNLLLCRLLEIPSSHSVPHIHIYFYQLQNLSEGCSQLVGLDQICWKRESFWPANSESLDRICLLYEVSAYFLIFSIYNCILGIYKQTNMLVLTAKKKYCALYLLVSTISQTKQRRIIQTGIMRFHSHEREHFHFQSHYLHVQSPTNTVTTQSTVAVSLERLLNSTFHCACSE